MTAQYDTILAFLGDLDKAVAFKSRMVLYMIGGAAITLAYDRTNRTADLDIIDAPHSLEKLAGRGTALAERYHVYLSSVAEINFSVPSDWRDRSILLSLPVRLEHFDLRIPCIEDLCLGKLARLEPKDLEDILPLVQRGQLFPERILARLNQNIKELKDGRYRNNVRLLFNDFLNVPVVFKGGKVMFHNS